MYRKAFINIVALVVYAYSFYLVVNDKFEEAIYFALVAIYLEISKLTGEK